MVKGGEARGSRSQKRKVVTSSRHPAAQFRRESSADPRFEPRTAKPLHRAFALACLSASIFLRVGATALSF